MRINFRQGIVRHQTSLSGPQWIQKTSLSGNSIDINAQTEPVIITFAHYGANYIFEESRSVVGAWGTGPHGSTNAPLTALGVTQYLYWDVDLATGALTRGWTLLNPVIAAAEPPNPANDQHWFDMTNTRMRVFRQPGSSPGSWQDKVRLFAAVYDQSAVLAPYPLGSQVGLTSTNLQWNCGNLILGTNNKPLKQSDGTFVTTDSDLIIHQTSGQNVRFDMALVFAQASEEIPKYFLVSFQPDRRIGLASSDNIFSFVSGIVVEDLHQEEVGQVITNGVVRNEQWNWTPGQINRPLFCGPTGELRLSPPLVGYVQQVGYVYDQDSIYMNLYPPVRIR
jgi:hypothetical protein